MEPIRTDLQYFEPTHTIHTSFTERTDAIVPDAEPDIGRILCAYASVSVKDELPQNDRILLSGTVSAVVLFRPDGQDTIRFLQIPLSFAHIEETPGILPESPCFVRCQVADVSASAVNSRKVSVTATLSLEVEVFAESGVSLTEGIDAEGDDALEVLYGSQTIPLLRHADVREYTVLDDVELAGAQGLRLISARGTLCPVSCQSGESQVTLSGEAVLSLLLLDDTGAIQPMSQVIPYTQVLDAPGLHASLPTSARLSLRNLDCMLREDGVLSVGLGVRALLLQQGEENIQTVRDLYHLHRILNFDTRDVSLCAYHTDTPFVLESSAILPVVRPAGEILMADGICLSLDTKSASPEARVQVSLLYRDPAGALCAEQQIVSAPLPNLTLPDGARPCDLSARVSASPGSDGNVPLRITVSGDLITQSQVPVRDITALSDDTPRPPLEPAGTTLILRYIHTAVPLWEIGKQYASTAQAIRQANALPDGTDTVADTMLLIPVYAQ